MTSLTAPSLPTVPLHQHPLIPLRKRSDFLRVQKSPLRWVTPGFVMSCEPSTDNQPTQIGFTITKKIGNAVVRNRIRRRFRHMMREHIPHLNVPGWTIILLARADALTRDYADLGKDLRWALRKLQAQLPPATTTPRNAS